jgi:hypothetical protein
MQGEAKVYKKHYWEIEADFCVCERCGLKKRDRWEVTKNLRRGSRYTEVYDNDSGTWNAVDSLPECNGTKRVNYYVK